MRGGYVLVGFASAGLVAASLVLAASASAMDTVNGTGGDDNLRGTAFRDTIRGFGGTTRFTRWPARISTTVGRATTLSSRVAATT
jgi:hypothetical protein